MERGKLSKKKRNAIFSFTPGFLRPKQRRAKGRVPYNRRVAGMLRKARKHRYDWIPEGGISPAKKKPAGVSSLVFDVSSALQNLGYSRQVAKKAAGSAQGSDFDSLFRSAMAKLKRNPSRGMGVAMKKSKKRVRKNRATKRVSTKAVRRRKKTAKLNPRRPARRIRKTVTRRRTRSARARMIKAPSFVKTPKQLKEFVNVLRRATGRRVRIKR